MTDLSSHHNLLPLTSFASLYKFFSPWFPNVDDGINDTYTSLAV